MPDAESIVAADLSVPPEAVAFALLSARTSYRKIRIKKKSGGVRVVLQPAIETKMLQEWVLLRVLSKLPISSIATAFERGSSILANAQEHRSGTYSVRVDLSNFFPSISFTDLETVLKRSTHALPPWALQTDVLNLISRTCFDGNERLPVGYPSSPRIANVVMRSLDEELLWALSSKKDVYGACALTRYADDFTFSTDKRGGCSAFVDLLTTALANSKSPRLQVNPKKTRFMSRLGGSTLITGLRVKQNGTIGVHANYRDHIRLLLKHYANGKLKSEELNSLRGHLAFISHADPWLLTKLSYRYFSEIAKINCPQPSDDLVTRRPEGPAHKYPRVA